MKGKVLFLDGRGDGWKYTIFGVIKENHPTAYYCTNRSCNDRMLFSNFIVVDGDKVDQSDLYIPSGYKIISMSINSDKEYDDCGKYYRFNSESKPSALIDAAKGL